MASIEFSRCNRLSLVALTASALFEMRLLFNVSFHTPTYNVDNLFVICQTDSPFILCSRA